MLTPACFPSLERHDAASRTDDRSQLTDDQWFLIEDLFEWQPPTRAGGRQRSAARASRRTGCRIDRPASQEPQETSDSGWPQAPPNEACTVASRTDERLAAELRPRRSSQGSPGNVVSGLDSTGLPVHYSQEVLTELLVKLW